MGQAAREGAQELSRQVREESNADLLIAVYSSAHLVAVWFGIAFLVYEVPSALSYAPRLDDAPLLCAVLGMMAAFMSALRLPVFSQ